MVKRNWRLVVLLSCFSILPSSSSRCRTALYGVAEVLKRTTIRPVISSVVESLLIVTQFGKGRTQFVSYFTLFVVRFNPSSSSRTCFNLHHLWCSYRRGTCTSCALLVIPLNQPLLVCTTGLPKREEADTAHHLVLRSRN